MSLSDSPRGPACPSRASGWVTHPPPGVSRVARGLRVQTCRRPYLGGTAGVLRSSGTGDIGLPHPLAGSAPTLSFFEACSAFTSVTACLLAGSPLRPFASEASAVSLPPLPLRLLPAGTTVCRGGVAPPEDPHLFTAHKRTQL